MTNEEYIILEDDHSGMVKALVKSGVEILSELTPGKADILHAAIGVFSEAGELADAVKKHIIYNKPMDYDNLTEELGDLEFYLEQLRIAAGINRYETLQANMKKLAVRYPGYKYTDALASERKDKA